MQKYSLNNYQNLISLATTLSTVSNDKNVPQTVQSTQLGLILSPLSCSIAEVHHFLVVSRQELSPQTALKQVNLRAQLTILRYVSRMHADKKALLYMLCNSVPLPCLNRWLDPQGSRYHYFVSTHQMCQLLHHALWCRLFSCCRTSFWVVVTCILSSAWL